MEQNYPVTDGDLIWGADAIARAIGRNRRQTYHLAAAGLIPVQKIGDRLVASRRRLHDFLAGESTTRPGSTGR